jgi:hypothetical protein
MYSTELYNQILSKNEQDKLQKLHSQQIEKEKIEKSLKEYEQELDENYKNLKQKNDNFIYTNQKLMMDRKKKEIVIKY